MSGRHSKSAFEKSVARIAAAIDRLPPGEKVKALSRVVPLAVEGDVLEPFELKPTTKATLAAIAGSPPVDPGPQVRVIDDLLRMAVWNAIFGVVGDMPALQKRIDELIAKGARL